MPVRFPLLRTRRMANGLGVVACSLLMGYALYAQYGLQLTPCPLCVLQRVAVILMGLLFLTAVLHNPGTPGARLYSIALVIIAALGMTVAGRHVWIQSLPPDQIPACGPGLDYMLEFFPLTEAMRMVFEGSGECAKIDWLFLGLSMPAWVFIALTGLGTYAVLGNWLLPRKSKT